MIDRRIFVEIAGQQVRGVIGRLFRVHHFTTDESWNSGKYSASSSAAMTMPSRMSSTRLDERDEALEARFQFLVVEIREAVQHVLQRSGGLAHLGHLDGDVRETRRGRASWPTAPVLHVPLGNVSSSPAT